MSLAFSPNQDSAGRRLDVYLAHELPELSRAAIQKLCDMGKVSVNGEQVSKSGYKIRLHDQISVNYDQAAADTVPAIAIPVLYEDDDCIVMDKPVGVLTHSKGAFNPEPTVATFIASRLTDLSGERGGIVHRLDRATSGVIIAAKNTKALSALQKQFSQRKAKKLYLAIVSGHLKQPEAIIDMAIERNPKAPATFRVGVNGKSAVTQYKVIRETNRYSLLELRPQTGRTHQLRVHLQEIGHPIVGDVLYGGKAAPRLFLHAQSLEITLPDCSRQTFSAELPKEFTEFLDNDD